MTALDNVSRPLVVAHQDKGGGELTSAATGARPKPATADTPSPSSFDFAKLLFAAWAWPEYATDAVQRSILFLDVLRQRGNEQIRISARPTATVLAFEHETLMSGHALPRPINYVLMRILPPAGVVIDPRKRPVVVVDPRAGQSSGIGGFKPQSEIGDALRAGHPVYFIGFSAKPVPGQDFIDVVEGQITFFEHVVQLHPDAPRPAAIGNCQAGYQTLMIAMLRPDLFGPCLVVGAPMSYWQGVRGKAFMRYAGGLSGGSWLTAWLSDLGDGQFDGAWLIFNFDNLNLSNFLWGKQYQVYANVDEGAQHYLEFEKWWGDFIELSGQEIQYLVDNMFVGDRLMRNELRSHDGRRFDVRNVKSPIVVFTSSRDNISPPPQTLGWILDVYQSVDDIRFAGQTIIYAVDQEAGHLGLFVSSRVADREDEQFVLLMDAIEQLPHGLYEMVISPNPKAASDASPSAKWTTMIVPRTLDDIRALGRNTASDDRAFAAAAKLSERNLLTYKTFVQPAVRALANPAAAEFARELHPLRLSYSLFAERNPWMTAVKLIAPYARTARVHVRDDNPYVALREQMSDAIGRTLDAYGAARDSMIETWFFGFFGAQPVQSWLSRDRAHENGAAWGTVQGQRDPPPGRGQN